MRESREIKDREESVIYEVRYRRDLWASQVGVSLGKLNHSIPLDDLETAVKMFNLLKDPNSDLSHELKPDTYSVELYKIFKESILMISD